MNLQSTTEIITAPKTTLQSPALWPFSPFDKSVSGLTIRGTWIFKEHLNADQLKVGLRDMLTFYPHLSGRIEWNAGVRMNNSGVHFTIDQHPGISVATVADGIQNIDSYSPILDKQKIKKGTSPCMGVKVTFLKDGTVLGVRCSHALLDGAGFYQMVNNWARICSGLPVEAPVVNQTLMTATKPLPSKADLLKEALSFGYTKLTLRALFTLITLVMPRAAKERVPGFHVPQEMIKELKRKVFSETGIECRNNDVLSALIINKCIELNRHAADLRKYSSVHVIDARQRVPSIPAMFAGNAAFAITTATFPANVPIHIKALTIHNGLAPMLISPSTVLGKIVALGLNTTEQKMPVCPFDFVHAYGAKPTVIYINNFSRLPIYCVDFGSGKPWRVIPHNLADPAAIWPAPPEKDGVEVYFTGCFAKAIMKLKPDDPWFNVMMGNSSR